MSRARWANALALAGLAAIALLLLGLHSGDTDWSPRPRPAAGWAAAASLLAYVALCVGVWWRTPARTPAFPPGPPPLLLVWASQTGNGLVLAERSAQALRSAGLDVTVCALNTLDAAVLGRSRRALFIASTTGEGDPPEHALPFLRRLLPATPSLAHLHYGVLALGDRRYAHFCAFGHQLDGWLRQHGAHALFDTVEVDNGDPASLRHWQQLLARLGPAASEQPDWTPAAYQPWRLLQRTHLNPGSVGGAVYWLRLQPPADGQARWQAGDIAEIGPRHPPAVVEAWLHAQGLQDAAGRPDGHALRARLARSHLPAVVVDGDLDALLDALQPLPHREYSIASVMDDGALELLVRQQQRADGSPGLGSGWLCDGAAVGTTLDVRLRRNPGFHGVAPEVPLILIGNGTGIAGLRAHLHERAARGARRTWLLFGERTAAHDFHFGDELRQMQQRGVLERLDAVFSRDGGEHRYVQHRLQARAAVLRQWVDDGATVLVCGSLQGMAPAVDAVIARVLGDEGREALAVAGSYRRDVY